MASDSTFSASGAPAADVAELRIDQLSWTEIRDWLNRGYTTAIVVAASIEQHGPHLPCDVDGRYGVEMAVRTARRLGNCLVTSAIKPGCSEHHMGFAGTISVSAELLTGTVEAYIRCLAEAGFKEMVLTSSHGGNFGPLSAALPRLQKAAADAGLALTPVLDLGAWIAGLNAALVDRGIRQGDVPAIQADLIETSLMLKLDPSVVHMERAEVGTLSKFDVEEMFTHGLKRMTANGILGDPRGASAELGEAIFQALEQYLVDAVKRARRS